MKILCIDKTHGARQPIKRKKNCKAPIPRIVIGDTVTMSARIMPGFAHPKLGDKIEIRSGSLAKPLFATLDEKIKNVTVPSWIKFDAVKKVAEIQGMPMLVSSENMFDLNAVVEFYSR